MQRIIASPCQSQIDSPHFTRMENTGNGYLPNNIPNWNYKYKPAFALFDLQGNLVQTWVDDNAEPSDWLHNTVHSYTYPVTFTDIPKGTYQWAIAIIDQTKDQQPGIKLAIKDKQEKKVGFYLMRSLFNKNNYMKNYKFSKEIKGLFSPQ